jgi:hypothetical protein
MDMQFEPLVNMMHDTTINTTAAWNRAIHPDSEGTNEKHDRQTAIPGVHA